MQQGQQKQMIYTHFGANSWQLELPNSGHRSQPMRFGDSLNVVSIVAHICSLAGLTVLVDPWLTGELTFAGQNWAFEVTPILSLYFCAVPHHASNASGA